jgi:hypothetical protein
MGIYLLLKKEAEFEEMNLFWYDLVVEWKEQHYLQS